MTILHNIVLTSEIESFSKKFVKQYGYGDSDLDNNIESTNNLNICWNSYADKSIYKIIKINNNSGSNYIAISNSGMIATSNDITGTWTDRTSNLTSIWGSQKKILTAQLYEDSTDITKNFVVIAGESAYCAWSKDGITWYNIENFISEVPTIITIKYDRIGTYLVRAAIGLVDPYTDFLKQIPVGETRQRGDLNNSGTITSADGLRALRYHAGALEIDYWAQTHISDYLINNYNTLNDSLKSLVNIETVDIWNSTTNNSTDANDIIDSFTSGSIVCVLGRSGQLGYITVNTDTNQSYTFIENNYKDTKTFLNGNVIGYSSTQSFTYTGQIYNYQSSTNIARLNITNTITSSMYIGQNFLTMTGTGNITYLSESRIIKILDEYNILVYTPGAVQTGTVSFTLSNYKNIILLSTVEDTNILVSNGKKTLKELINKKLSNSNNNVDYNKAIKPIRTLVYDSENLTRKETGLVFTSTNGYFTSTTDLGKFYKSNDIIPPRWASAGNILSSKLKLKINGSVKDYLAIFNKDEKDSRLILTDQSSNSVEYYFYDFSLSISKEIIIGNIITSIDSAEEFDSNTGVTSNYLILGSNTGTVFYCKTSETS